MGWLTSLRAGYRWCFSPGDAGDGTLNLCLTSEHPTTDADPSLPSFLLLAFARVPSSMKAYVIFKLGRLGISLICKLLLISYICSPIIINVLRFSSSQSMVFCCYCLFLLRSPYMYKVCFDQITSHILLYFSTVSFLTTPCVLSFF